MELINLLNQRNWTGLGAITRPEIEMAMRRKISGNVKKLYQSYYRGLLLNLFFLLSFGSIYLIQLRIEFLVPVVLISCSFGFIILNLLYHLLKEQKVDPSGDIKTVVQNMLAFDKKLYTSQGRCNQLILMFSFIGGFLLGLAFQGWTIEKYLDKPIIFPILFGLSAGFYFFTKARPFKQFNRWLNPGYFKAKSFLEEQLELLSADE